MKSLDTREKTLDRAKVNVSPFKGNSHDTSEMSKNIKDASLVNLKPYEGKWRLGATRTIRVPIALADATLEYALLLDNGIKPSVTSDLGEQVKALMDELERLQSELGNLRADNEVLRTAQPATNVELPEAPDLLNQLKAKRKKATASLADIEAILEILEES
jgi:hypothetical protein